MKTLSFLFSVILLAGCSSSLQNPDLVLPEIQERTPLPMYPTRVVNPHLSIELEYLVAEDGTVRHVRLLNSSGNREWDDRAVTAIMQWKYSPALYQGKPVRLWLRQTATIQFSEPLILHLAEIVCLSQNEADSVYQLLQQGTSFSEAVKLFSKAASRTNNGILGKVNVHSYPEHIQEILAQLDTDEYSVPVRYGTSYIIFKKIPPETKEYFQ